MLQSLELCQRAASVFEGKICRGETFIKELNLRKLSWIYLFKLCFQNYIVPYCWVTLLFRSLVRKSKSELWFLFKDNKDLHSCCLTSNFVGRKDIPVVPFKRPSNRSLRWNRKFLSGIITENLYNCLTSRNISQANFGYEC